MKIKGLKKIKDAYETVTDKKGNKHQTGEKIAIFRAPDGFTGTYKKFINEAERGLLHGCIIASS